MTHDEAAAKWKALDGFRFAGDTFEIRMDSYRQGGRPAADVFGGPNSTCPGEPWVRLTVNLPDEALAPGEFHARLEDIEHASTVFATLRAEGKIERVGRIVGAGMNPRYAEVWRIL